MNPEKLDFKTKIISIIMAFIVAIFLFIYVQTQKTQSTTSTDNSRQEQLAATKSTTINAPLKLNGNTDKYFITGYPQKVKIRLEGPAALVTATANTLNFQIVADIANRPTGIHKITLREQGINKSIHYQIMPSYVTINIQARSNRKMAIQTDFNKDSIALGYEAGQPVLSQDTVEVTSAKTEIEKINQVVAKVNLPNDAKTTFSQDVIIQPLDQNGNIVNAVVNPEVIHVRLPIKEMPHKTVKIKFTQDGQGVAGKSYSFKSNVSELKIYGKKDVIDRIDTLAVPVVVNGVEENVQRIIELPEKDGIKKYGQKAIPVNIIVKNSSKK
ncbi:CdaR family protein [Xylocopilactobacillus apis]|uniref:YbbR domain-containing protein n=1 Tax=Xylocopilactobacillus apis TaxID=2932183 RepID=A0AAU9D790_9LACO|nr:CdaR family protein [Xylocopilactobacillus apis]BDR56642.1 hypothetical protein KIMC2_12040 [Xylocopilactobacillus apis]